MIDALLLNIIEEQVKNNTLDFVLFLEQAGTCNVSELEFAEAYGRAAYCRRVYPDIPIPVALGIMHRNRPYQKRSVMSPSIAINQHGSCGSCGGGKVR